MTPIVNQVRAFIKNERGVGIMMVLSFMALSIPMLAASLSLASTLSVDSRVKSNLAKNQYSSLGALQYVRYLSSDPDRWDDWLDVTGGIEDLTIDDDDVNITSSSNGTSDLGFLNYCIFGSSSVKVKEDAIIQCSIGSNGDVEIKENTQVTGNIVSGGNVMLKENAIVYGDVTAAGTVTLKTGASVTGTLQQSATVPTITGPTPAYNVTVTLTDPETGVSIETVDVEGGSLSLVFNLTGGGSDVTVNTGETVNLLPGSYGVLNVKEGGTLNLSAGNYAFNEVYIKENSNLNLDASGGQIVVDAVDVLEFKEEVNMAVTGGTAADFAVRVQDAAQFKEDGVYVGTYFGFEADLAEMHVKERSSLVGALYGDIVEIKEEATVTGAPATDVYLSFFGL